MSSEGSQDAIMGDAQAGPLAATGLGQSKVDLRLLSLSVFCDVYVDEVKFTVMAYDERTPAGKRSRKTVARHAFPRRAVEEDAWAVAATALSWYIDQLDREGGWELPS